jgi:predicted nucleic acid-binding protein
MDVVLDTSTLINFLRIDRLDLLTTHPLYAFLITDHVRREISEYYADQLAAVTQAVEAGELTELVVTSPEEVEIFAKLSALRTLGSGECSAIAVAKNRSLTLAIDDIRAKKQAMSMDRSLATLSTAELIASLIKVGRLTIEEADAMKRDWEDHHRFRLPFSSFRDFLTD